MIPSASLTALNLAGPTRAVAEFERLGLINRAVTDATAVDLPLVGMANNKADRIERFVRQALVLAIGFLIAPLHAKLLFRHFSKKLGKQAGIEAKGLSDKLLQLSYRDLADVKKLKDGTARLFKEEFNEGVPQEITEKLGEALRKQLVSAKSKFLMSDLALLCTLFSSVGFIRVLAGKLFTGKEQFSAEMGVIQQNKLDELYKKEHSRQTLSKHTKEIATLSLGVALPVALGGMMWRKYLKPGRGGLIRKMAPTFDYVFPRATRFLKGWPMMSVAGLVVSSLILTVGELAAARSKREFKNLAIQRNSIDGLFFFGTPLLMTLFNGGAHSIQAAVEKKAKQTKDPALLRKAANRSAWLFGISFVLNLLAVAGIVTLTNRMAKADVKKDAQALNTPPAAPPPPPIFRPPAQPFQPVAPSMPIHQAQPDALTGYGSTR